MESNKNIEEEKVNSDATPESGSSNDSGVDDSAVENLLQKQVENLSKELLYQRADFDNQKKRLIKEQDQAIRFANERLIKDLLTVVDLFDRGLPHGQSLIAKPGIDKDVVNFVNGIDMTRRELAQLLGRYGVELIGEAGEKFDPNRHEAISQIESPDHSEDTVAQVFSKGSLLNGRLLAPAKVAVGKNKAEN